MTMDRSFIELNRASSRRLRALADRLNDRELQKPVGTDWTVAVTFAHLAFWDRRVLHALEVTERNDKLFVPEIDFAVNDFARPLWAAIPPREAAKIAIETAESLDARLATFPAELLEQLYRHSERLVLRALHRNEHLDAVEAALKS